MACDVSGLFEQLANQRQMSERLAEGGSPNSIFASYALVLRQAQQCLLELTHERDTCQKRAEAAVQDLRSVIKYADKGCELCAHYIPCAGKDCSKYISGTGATGQDGKEYPDFKWTCEDFDYGQCPAMENTPCNGCDFVNHWQWRGPCAEDGGTDENTCSL